MHIYVQRPYKDYYLDLVCIRKRIRGPTGQCIPAPVCWLQHFMACFCISWSLKKLSKDWMVLETLISKHLSSEWSMIENLSASLQLQLIFALSHHWVGWGHNTILLRREFSYKYQFSPTEGHIWKWQKNIIEVFCSQNCICIHIYVMNHAKKNMTSIGNF